MFNKYTALFQNYIQHSNEKRKAAHMLVSFLKKHLNNTLLDCGCGTGFFTKAALPYCSKILSLDKEKRLPDQLLHHPKIKFLKGDFLELDQGEKFDIVLAAYVLWEIPFSQWDHLFRKFRSCLKQNGFLIVIDSYQRSELDNPFFNFNTHLKKMDEYPDWHEYLNEEKIAYESRPFTAQITGKNPEEMYEILRFFFQRGEAEIFYTLNKNKIMKDLESKSKKNRVVITVHQVMDCVYFMTA